MAEARYVYGACCTWHGPIAEVKTTGGEVTINGRKLDVSIPACPHCRGPLMEYPTRAKWDEQATAFMVKNPDVPLYKEWLESLRVGPCRSMKDWDWRASYAAFAGPKQ